MVAIHEDLMTHLQLDHRRTAYIKVRKHRLMELGCQCRGFQRLAL